MADLLDPAALHAARQWAETHGHPQPDDRMLAAYGQVITENIARAIEVKRGDRCPTCRGKAASSKPNGYYTDRRCGAGHMWSTHVHWMPFDAAAIARRAGDGDGTATP